MRRWVALVKKEWRSSWTILALAVAAIALFDIWLAVKAPVWQSREPGMAAGISLIPMVGIAIALLPAAHIGLRSEWGSRTSMRLLSYPVGGASVLWSKLAILLVNFAIVTAAAAAGTWLVVKATPGAEAMASPIFFLPAYSQWEIWSNVVWLVITVLTAVAFVFAVSMLAFVIGTLVPRLSGLLSVVVWGLIWYVVLTYGFHVVWALSFLPTPRFILYTPSASELVRRTIPMINLWPTVLGTAAMILAAGKILDVEVDA